MTPIVLPRDLDLRRCKDRQHLLDLLAAQQDSFPKETSEVHAGIESLAIHFPDAPWLIVPQYLGGSFHLQVSAKHTQSIPLLDMIALGLQLARLKECDGFEVFLSGFANLMQFRDSMFEASMADYCLARSHALRFSPEYEVRGHLKHPDFEMDSDLGKIVCECKGLDDREREYSRQLQRVMAALQSAAQAAGVIPEDHRLEVHLRGPIKQDVDKVAQLICATAYQAETGKLCEVDGLFCALKAKSEPIAFPNSGIAMHTIVVGTTAVGLGAENASLRLTTERLDGARIKAAGSLVNKAKSQLPESERCAIFIDVLNPASGIEAAKRRLNRPDYKHVMTVGVVSSRIDWTYVTSRHEEVSAVFGPFDGQ